MILLDIRLSRIEERCTLMHEIVHAERGPFSLWLIAGEEAAVDVETALWFSPDALGMLSLGRCIPRSPLWRFSRNPRSHLAQDLRRTPGGPGVLLTRRRSPALQADSSPKGWAMGHAMSAEPSFRTRRRSGWPVFEERESLGFAGMRALALLEAV